MQVEPALESVAAGLIGALAARDWERLAACFAPDAVFRAVVPNPENPFRELRGPEEAAGQLARWFGDADELELLSSSIGELPGSVRFSYRFAAHEDQWYVVEQQCYATIGPRGIENLQLVCSGFQPIAARPGPVEPA